jgi:hypothetical protein
VKAHGKGSSNPLKCLLVLDIKLDRTPPFWICLMRASQSGRAARKGAPTIDPIGWWRWDPIGHGNSYTLAGLEF